MAPTAQWALQDFVRVAGEEGCTLYFEQFLKEGFSAWPANYRTRFPGLRTWGGVKELKTALGAYVGLSKNSCPLLAGRSTNLMRLSARLLFRGGNRIVTTDLTWPSYEKILEREGTKVNGRIECLRVRAGILRGEISGANFMDLVLNRFIAAKCSGVFLPGISHDGLRLPIADLVHALHKLACPAFIVVDGAQAVGHVPLDLSQIPCDFYLGGCHKWMGSHLPLGIGFCPNPATRSEIENECSQLIGRGSLDDPLMAFVHSIETGRQRRFTETVNLSPLFSCRGALEDQTINGPIDGHYRRRRANADLVRRIARMTGWIPFLPAEEFRSASVLLRATSSIVRGWSPTTIRERFHQRGIALTCYDRGIVRMAMPSVPFSANDIGLLIQALALVPPHASYRESEEALSA